MSEIVQHKQHLQKVLEDANVKLGSVVSDVLGDREASIVSATCSRRAGGGMRRSRPARRWWPTARSS